ncbi:hypothetical protein Q6294_29030, partial [Klebsiella pneumoniae]
MHKIPVGGLQRPENQCWRGFPAGPFGYNESPTSSCHTFCWKARHLFDVPFFCLRHGPGGPPHRCAIWASNAMAFAVVTSAIRAADEHEPHPQLLHHCP